jgi:hypothetical protein
MADTATIPTSPGYPSLEHAASWYNLSAWAVNVTRYAPSFEDIVWAGPRMFMKLGSFVASSDQLHAATSQQLIGSAPLDSDPLGSLVDHQTIYNTMETAASAGAGADADPVSHVSRLSVDGARGLGSVFSYATSRWAISCIAMAIVLNRTHIFAATRRRSRFTWHVRAVLRLLPVVLLGLQARSLLRSIQCQTSPDFALLRWGNATRSSDLMFSHHNPVLNTVSSVLLFGASDQESCAAVAMTPATEDTPPHELRGSLSALWPLFGTFCLSHFFETLSCAIQGRPITAETGMTLFEQSLAFAEADAAVSNQLGWGTFSSKDAMPSQMGTSIALTRSMILRRVNTPPEVLLVALLSALSHLSSHVLGIFDRQAKYRLVNTGFWGLCFMASIVWSVISFDLDEPASQGLLRYPTVCIIGFVPHVLVLAGIITCSFIYGLAIVLSALASSSNPELATMTFRQRIAHAHENMQANVSLSEIRINKEMDFYTALLRTGFAAITMASEAVYLNEDRGVSLKHHTWLEEARLREAEEMHKQLIGMGLPSSKYDQIGAIGLIPVKGGLLGASNGYARERAAQKVPKGRERAARSGIGATERSSRWLMAFEFMLSISKLMARLFAITMLGFLALLRIRAQPAWLLWLAQRPKLETNGGDSKQTATRNTADPSLVIHTDGFGSNADGLDVEAEFRRVDQDQDDEVLEKDLYNYWLKGGWWGSNDSSGDFKPAAEDDWDNTSVISMSTCGGESDGEGWESEDSGQRTPTQHSPRMSRQGTPAVDSPLHIGDLARLLHPQSPEEREEALNLSAHFQSDRIMTRSQFRRQEQLKRTKILTMTTPRPGPDAGRLRNTKLSPEEEERLLEQLLLTRRLASSQEPAEAVQWQQGAAGMGGDGPQCVVCQCSPRTIIVWPCRCLSLCDDCRVSLAMNNFDKCVCCRREVISFSRIFVP